MESFTKQDIRSLSLDELESFFESIAEKKYKAKQVYNWLWKKSVFSFSEMTNISKSTRSILEKKFIINNISIDSLQKSNDGTIKNSIKLHDGLLVESVLIPSNKRMTACISSQVGCSLDCSFCGTSLLKRIRNLNPDEIYDQVVTINKQSKSYYEKSLTNIVFMGMGEPLMNYKNVLLAIKKITEPESLGISSRRITLSTSGIPKMIKKLADDNVKFGLAVSLHSARQEIREQIMPFAKNFHLDDLMDSLKYWHEKRKKIITFEYVIWKGINDKYEDIISLINFCNQVPSKVNLIQYNSIGNSNFIQASKEKIKEYEEALEKANITFTTRRSRGQDIDAACGQLANKTDQFSTA